MQAKAPQHNLGEQIPHFISAIQSLLMYSFFFFYQSDVSAMKSVCGPQERKIQLTFEHGIRTVRKVVLEILVKLNSG
jgi:hypothetical protein